MNWRRFVAQALYWLGVALSLPGLALVLLSDLIQKEEDWSPLE